jgi:uncharacterized membrane protein YccC
MNTSLAPPRLSRNLTGALIASREPLLFGLRLWASVSLALFIAFWLQLDNPFWAGTSAAVVCQPQLGAALRKGWFRMIGTVIGATMVVALTAWFPQDRILFLGLLALWGGVCAFSSTLLRNFASYSAALAGYTAVIIAADTLGATGGASSDVFMIAVWRASEICIGIASAGVVLASTDFGGAQRKLAASLADLASELMNRFLEMLASGRSGLPDTQTKRRELARRVIALDPMIDRALGESSRIHYHSSTLQNAVGGLFGALDGWRGVATHLSRLPDASFGQDAKTILSNLPSEQWSTLRPGLRERWLAAPVGASRAYEGAAQTLLALPVGTPSLRLLADETVKVLSGVVCALDALALLVDAPDPLPADRRGFHLSVPDWSPALANAARAFVAISAVELFWVITAWPYGASAMVFVAVLVLRLASAGDRAYGGAIGVTLGAIVSILCAGLMKFAALPPLETFAAFCAALAIFYVPIGFAMAGSTRPAAIVVSTAMASLFMPLLAPTNQMTYDTSDFYNTALAALVGCCAGAFAFRMLPTLSPALLARRLLAFALRDLRGVANAPRPSRPEDWDSRMFGRLAALPDQAEPLQRARLLAALSVGAEIITLREIAPRLGAAAEVAAASRLVALSNSEAAIAKLRRLDRRLASGSDPRWDTTLALRARGRILVIVEALAEHRSYFDAGARA